MRMSSSLPHLYRGKVRDLYAVDDHHMMMVASDRISAFDVVMSEPVNDKGRVLTALSAFFFAQTRDLVPNHVVTVNPDEFPEGADPMWAGRAMLVRRTDPIRMECIVRGYLFGGAWKEYQERQTINGVAMPDGLQLADVLPAPRFTPSTKAESGHDMPMTRAEGEQLVGAARYAELEAMSVALYERAAKLALERGVVLADTKFEFGVLDGSVIVIDEMCTPDSSRYWPAEAWQPGSVPPSFDKQFLRDALDASGWDHTPPPPPLAPAVLAGTRDRYIEAYELLTGNRFADWYAPPVVS
jgi:phosphoribosylaminoimidazole-succinocarboxamide synthase